MQVPSDGPAACLFCCISHLDKGQVTSSQGQATWLELTEYYRNFQALLGLGLRMGLSAEFCFQMFCQRMGNMQGTPVPLGVWYSFLTHSPSTGGTQVPMLSELRGYFQPLLTSTSGTTVSYCFLLPKSASFLQMTIPSSSTPRKTVGSGAGNSGVC